MARLNRTCFTCGVKYSYCPSCYEDYGKPTWMVMYHDENCKNIFETISNNYYGHISDADAIMALNKCNLSVDLTTDLRRDIENLKNKKIVPKKSVKNSDTKFLKNSE